jgi:flavin reductase (DIM6/NTAB) family NADH-FMN oxidoreductase RutF
MCFDILERSVDSPMTVVTAGNGGERSGCLVGFWTQCSIEPPRCVIMLSKSNHTFRVARFAPTLAVHVLRERDQALAERFGAETGDDVDKFAGLAWNVGPGGAPVLEGVDWFAGTVGQVYDVGDHVAVIIDVLTNVGNHGRAHEHQLDSRTAESIPAGHAP